jgi:hypothetical protein
MNNKKSFMKKFLRNHFVIAIALVIATFLISGSTLNAATYFSRANGNWNVNTTWSLTSGGAAVGAGVFPVAGDVVIIEGGFNVTIPAGFNAFCTTLNIANAGAGIGTLTFAATSMLTVSGNVTVGQSGSGSREGTIDMSLGGTLTCSGSLTLGNDGATTPNASVITQGAGSTITITGTATILQPGNDNFYQPVDC